MPAPTQEPPISLERYATLHAEIEASAELDSVLEREQVKPETWLAAQAYWLKRMADEAHRKRFEITTRYQAVFTAKRKGFEARFARDRRRTEHLPSLPARDPAADGSTDPSSAFHGSSHAAPHHAPPMPATPMMGGLTPAPPLPVMATPVFRPAEIAPPQRVVSSPDPPVHAAGGKFSSTMLIEPQAPRAAATPFVAGAAVSAPPAVVSPPAVNVGGDTAPLDLSADMRRQLREALPLPQKNPSTTGVIDEELMRAARAALARGPAGLPFEAGKPGARPPATIPVQPGSVAAQAATSLDDDDDSPRTKLVDGDALAAAIAKVTPFEDRKKPPSGPPPSEDSPRTVAFDAPLQRRDSLPFGSAATVPNPAAVYPPLPPIATPGPPPLAPAGAAAAAKPRRFSINVFASLTAEIAESPGETEAIRLRYGLSESDHHEESMRWTQEFQQNDETRQRYFGIVQRYRGYIQQRKKV